MTYIIITLMCRKILIYYVLSIYLSSGDEETLLNNLVKALSLEKRQDITGGIT